MLQALAALLFFAGPQSDSYYPTTGAAEAGRQPGVAAQVAQAPQDLPGIRLERLSADIPWPRGIAWTGEEFVVVARGRHRNYGGPARDFEDHGGRLYRVDPNVYEPYEPGAVPGAAVRANNRVLAEPDPLVVNVLDRSGEPIEDTLAGRPYCTLVYDAPSRNVIFCAYSGIDVAEAPFFRKNATDALYRYDLRTNRWGVVELHRDGVVPADARGPWISNEYYPHHDPQRNPPPHGWLNGPNSCAVAGDWLYAAGKDNHTLARYDLRPIRKDPDAGPPPSEFVLGERARVRVLGEEREIELVGHSAVAAGGGWLYLGTRTNSVIVRFPLRPDGDLVRPLVGELVAEFEPWTPESKRSADLWELAVDERGRVYASCSRSGRVWRFQPDPMRPFDGNDFRKDPPTQNRPYLDLPALTGIQNARISNLAFDPQGRLVFCATMSETHSDFAGAIFRVIEEPAAAR